MYEIKVRKIKSRVRKDTTLTIVELLKDGKVIDEIGRTYRDATHLIMEGNKLKNKMNGWKGDNMIEANSVELATRLNSLVEEVKETKNNLCKELSIVDLKISDIQHYIENKKLNGVEGYKAYKLLQDTLKERRVIKNKISEIEPLYQNLIVTNKMENKARELKRKVTETQRKNSSNVYNVRVMKDVFGNVII